MSIFEWCEEWLKRIKVEGGTVYVSPSIKMRRDDLLDSVYDYGGSVKGKTLDIPSREEYLKEMRKAQKSVLRKDLVKETLLIIDDPIDSGSV